ncbi:MAG: 5,10-methylenetetrahydrofolate reductase [Nocardioides sp.]|nr:5,10-methylenetetrahydrofolate reductase [Nocardioides sp.]
MTTLTLPLVEACPKKMRLGPCGGVGPDGGCEIDPSHACLFLEPEWASAQAASAPVTPATHRTAPGTSAFQDRLDSGAFGVVAEVNGPDTVDVTEFVTAAERIAEVADVVSVTDHSGATVHMGNVAATAHLLARGLEVMPTFGCRDRNRMALQGDLLGIASLGARNALLVTGNHPEVGDSPDATPVFDLDSPRLLQVAARMRDEGRYANGRPIEERPRLYLGATAHPFAQPYDDRPGQVLRKVVAGADFVISQHVFDLPLWRRFVDGVNALRGDAPPFHLLGGVAILPDEPIARRVNAGLRGFSIPEETLTRLRQARDPQAEGITIAAEIVAELDATDGVSGCLLAPVTGRSNALTASAEQTELIAEVRRQAGVPVPVSGAAS